MEPTRPALPASALTLGLASHAVAGVSPFVVAATIGRVGLMPATALIYLAGSTLLLLTALAPTARARFVRESVALWHSPARAPLVWALAGFLVAGLAYYQGLSRSARVGEYVFLTRLDWAIQTPVAIVLLGERWTGRGLGGAALALAGGLVLAWTGTVGTSGITAAGLYIAASLVGYVYATPITAARGVDGAVAMTVWRHAVNTVGFTALALPTWPAAGLAFDLPTLLLIGAGGLIIVALFLLRFAALTGIPLWVLSAQAPVQATVALTLSWLTEGQMRPTTLLAIGMIVVGEAVVAAQTRLREQPLPG